MTCLLLSFHPSSGPTCQHKAIQKKLLTLIGCNKLNAFKLLWKISTVIIRSGGKSFVKVLSLFERYLEVNLTEKKLISYCSGLCNAGPCLHIPHLPYKTLFPCTNDACIITSLQRPCCIKKIRPLPCMNGIWAR